MPNDAAPELNPQDRELYESGDARQIYINPLLHRRLKLHAAERDKSIGEIAEPNLWPLVGGEPAVTEAAS